MGKTTSFWRFYCIEIWRAPSKLMRALFLVEHAIAIGLFVAWIYNKETSDEAWRWLGERSQWWFIIAIAIAFLHAYLVSNYAAFNRLEKQINQLTAKVPIGTLASLRIQRNYAVTLKSNYQHLDPSLAIPLDTTENWYRNRDAALRIMRCVEEILNERQSQLEAFNEPFASLRAMSGCELTKANSSKLLNAIEGMVECFEIALEDLSRD